MTIATRKTSCRRCRAGRQLPALAPQQSYEDEYQDEGQWQDEHGDHAYATDEHGRPYAADESTRREQPIALPAAAA